MKLNIVLHNNCKERLMNDLAEVYPDSNITELADYDSKIVAVEISDKDKSECVYPLGGLCELQSWYGYEIRIY